MTSQSSKQHGFMTVMFLILLGLFLTFAALAIDLGNYYLWNLRLDKAARAGALAGLGARGLQGWNAVNGDGMIYYNAAKAAVNDSLVSYGFTRNDYGGLDEGPTIPQIIWSPVTDQITVELHYYIPTLLVGRIRSALGWAWNEGGNETEWHSGGPSKIEASVRQSAQLSRANVVLLLDVSGSMLCPITDPPAFAGQPPCACRRSAGQNACGNAPTKLSQMAIGVSNFVSQFNPNRDRISVIPFNLAARRLFSFFEYQSVNGPGSTTQATLNNQVLQNAILNPDNSVAVAAGTTQWNMLINPVTLTAGLTALAGSNTNHCDALAEAIRDLETLSADVFNTGDPAERDRRKLQPFVVLFTDGAPNAMRGIFPNTAINPGGDFYHYALEWVVPNANRDLAPFTYRGPGPFVLRTADAANAALVQPLFRFPITSGSVAPPPQVSPTCGIPQSNFWQFEQGVTQNTTGGPGGRGAPTGCLTTQTFNFAIPYTDYDAQGNQLVGNFQAQVQNIPISTANTTWRDPNWPPTANGIPAYGLQKYDELPYYCAVEAADYLRLHFGATIFAIGLGQANNTTNPTNCTDILMDADNHSARKDAFLSRLAFSRQAFTDQLVPVALQNQYRINVSPLATVPNPRQVTGCANHRYRTGNTILLPQLTIGYNSTARNHASQASPGAIKSDNLADVFKMLRPFHPNSTDPFNQGANAQNFRRIDTMGEYFATNDPTEVPAIFSNIAKTILLRSTS